MIKHFCDVCGAEIQGDHTQIAAETSLRSRETKRPHKLAVSITVAGAVGEGAVELCTDCVFRAVGQVNPAPMRAEDR